jgi:hypothetical protein
MSIFSSLYYIISAIICNYAIENVQNSFNSLFTVNHNRTAFQLLIRNHEVVIKFHMNIIFDLVVVGGWCSLLFADGLFYFGKTDPCKISELIQQKTSENHK